MVLPKTLYERGRSLCKSRASPKAVNEYYRRKTLGGKEEWETIESRS